MFDQEFFDFAKNYETVNIAELLIKALVERFVRMEWVVIVYFDAVAVAKLVVGNCFIDFTH